MCNLTKKAKIFWKQIHVGTIMNAFELSEWQQLQKAKGAYM